MSKQSEWRKHLMEVYKDMKKSNPDVQLKDAMIIAKRSWRR